MKKIKLYNLFGNSISSRAAIRNVIECNNLNTKLLMDFDNIFFISRSAAHQLLSEKYEKRNIEFINLDPEVEKMLNALKSIYFNSQTTDLTNLVTPS